MKLKDLLFVTIAIGEFLYKVVAPGNLGIGFSDKFGRGIFLLADAYILFWIYTYGSTSQKQYILYVIVLGQQWHGFMPMFH